jgi:SAM-dependent methyltransferase
MKRIFLCPACGGRKTEDALAYVKRPRPEDDIFTGLSLWFCSDCHTHFAEPCPEPSILEKYYMDTYRQDGRNSAVLSGFPADNLWYLSRGLSVAHLVRSVFDNKIPKKMRVIDIGAGYGHVIYALRAVLENQLETTAVELDSRCHPTLARVADHVVDRNITEILPTETYKGAFDLALMLHVIEHLADPFAFICQVKKILAPGGLMIIEVPNCTSARIRWYNLETPHVPHLVFFTKDGLGSMLRRAGMDLLLLDSYGPAFDSTGSYDPSFTRSPIDPSSNIKHGITPAIPYPIFSEPGLNRHFLRAIARLNTASQTLPATPEA